MSSSPTLDLAPAVGTPPAVGSRRSAVRDVARWGAWLTLGAAVWIVVILTRLLSVNERWWIARDDGVITLSHARNAAKFGSIGVSPGGDRVEGFSSPLHFAAAFVIQLVTEPGYRALTLLVLVVGLAVTGAAIVWGMKLWIQTVWPGVGYTGLYAVCAALVAALVTASSWTVTGWLGSGMENPLVLAAGASVVAAGLACDARGRFAPALLVIGISALLVSRVEFAAFGVPVAVAAGAVLATSRTRARSAIAVAVAPMAVAAIVHASRRLYFGEWLPNTALVQQRYSGVDQFAAIGSISLLLLALLTRTLIRKRSMGTSTGWGLIADPGASIVALTSLAGIAWMSASGRTAGTIDQLLVLPPLLPLVVLVGIFLLVHRSLGGSIEVIDHLALAVATMPIAQYLITGPARLDEFRIAGLSAAFLSIWLVVILARISLRLPMVARRRGWSPRIVPTASISVAALLLVSAVWTTSNDGARALSYEIAWADTLTDVARTVRSQQLDGEGQVILANPDLGKVSFDKSAVMVDLGLLGDPVLARITIDHPALVAEYLGKVAVPDVVSTHSGWSCAYRDWIESTDFVRGYELYEMPNEEWTRPPPSCPLDGLRAVWTRTSGQAEYALTRQLLSLPGGQPPIDAVSTAVRECSSPAGSNFRCQHVRRAVQRAGATLRSHGSFSAVVAEFDASPSRALDVELLHRSPGWGERATDAFITLAGE